MNRLLTGLCILCVAGVFMTHGQEPAVAASTATNGSTQIEGSVPRFQTLFPPLPPGFVHNKTVIWNSAKRPHMGVQIRDLSAQLAKFFHVDEGGVLVEGVEPGGPAERAGVKAGDIITRLDDKVIDASDALTEALDGRKDGEEITLGLVRREKRWEATLTLAECTTQSSTLTFSRGDENSSPGGQVTYGQQRIEIDIQKLLGSMGQHVSAAVALPPHASAREQEALRKELDELKREMQELRKALQQVSQGTRDNAE